MSLHPEGKSCGLVRYRSSACSQRPSRAAVSYTGSGLLLANYVFAVGLAVARPSWFNQPLMIGAHCLFALFLVVKTRALESERYTKGAVQRYYQNIW